MTFTLVYILSLSLYSISSRGSMLSSSYALPRQFLPFPPSFSAPFHFHPYSLSLALGKMIWMRISFLLVIGFQGLVFSRVIPSNNLLKFSNLYSEIIEIYLQMKNFHRKSSLKNCKMGLLKVGYN